jgi:hypothetical protein
VQLAVHATLMDHADLARVRFARWFTEDRESDLHDQHRIEQA